MKMLGGDWSKGDLLALIGLIVAIVGIWVAHRDTAKTEDTQPVQSRESSADSATSGGKAGTTPAAPQRVPRSSDVSSGQLNFGCEETKQAKTPEVFFGSNTADIQPRAEWGNTDNAKGQNQQVVYDRDAASRVRDVFAEGSFTGLDKQLFNCPGGGHGT